MRYAQNCADSAQREQEQTSIFVAEFSAAKSFVESTYEERGKEHKNVMQSIREIFAAENSATRFFHESTYEKRGQEYRRDSRRIFPGVNGR